MGDWPFSSQRTFEEGSIHSGSNLWGTHTSNFHLIVSSPGAKEVGGSGEKGRRVNVFRTGCCEETHVRAQKQLWWPVNPIVDWRRFYCFLQARSPFFLLWRCMKPMSRQVVAASLFAALLSPCSVSRYLPTNTKIATWTAHVGRKKSEFDRSVIELLVFWLKINVGNWFSVVFVQKSLRCCLAAAGGQVKNNFL